MHASLVVIDDFLAEADALRLRAQAIEAEYAPYAAAPHVNRTEPAGVASALERALHIHADVIESGFRIDYAGESQPLPVHFDTEHADYAVLLYLNLPHQCTGGTAFWRHRETGAEGIPPDGTHEIETAYFKELSKPEEWDLASVIAMRWNRLVVYPTHSFHSRYPFEGFGSQPSDGRLVAGLFFNSKEGHSWQHSPA